MVYSENKSINKKNNVCLYNKLQYIVDSTPKTKTTTA